MKAWKRVLAYSIPTALVLSAAPAVIVGQGDPLIIGGGFLLALLFFTAIGMAFIAAESAIDKFAPKWLRRILYAKVLPGIPNVGPAADEGASTPKTHG